MDNTILKHGICYAGLAYIFGGKLWYVHTPDGETYHNTKKEAAKTIRRAWSDNKPVKRAILAQLAACKGRAYIYC